eukprot:CAMPEP_0116884474 /NCGR_PEP_ID=MMETSP0463-20121206/17390_1 /TAXON_ID=181622 /ORGANISM="Strombidinopsis sp, Strain SopsisLIS2011" /LENGTH=53 /DNA_ID=CAMNT_0004541063 /DNA_START=818 /DNA_END=976 /DNA_ORIENTATION=-
MVEEANKQALETYDDTDMNQEQTISMSVFDSQPIISAEYDTVEEIKAIMADQW